MVIIMKSLSVGEFKSHFSDVLKDVQKGQQITIEYGKRHQKIAVIIPFNKYIASQRKIGPLKGKASFEIPLNFKMTDNDLFQS